MAMTLHGALGVAVAVSGLSMAVSGLSADAARASPGGGSAPEIAATNDAPCTGQTQGATVAPSVITAERHRYRLAKALQNGFGVQYWGQTYTVETLAAAPHGLLIIEATTAGADQGSTAKEVLFTYDEVRRISRNGTRPVLAYLNVAEIEPYREYWIRSRTSSSGQNPGASQKWIGPRTGNAEQLALYWTPEWQAILQDRVDRLMSLGFDGIFLDDVLQYYSFASGSGLNWPGTEAAGQLAGAPAYARAMMRLVENVAARSRDKNCDAIIIVNNGVFIGRDAGPDKTDGSDAGAFARYLAAIDAILVEGVFASSSRAPTIAALKEDFFNNGTEVLALDFGTLFPSADVRKIRETLSQRAVEVGFTSYLANNGAFDRLYPPITRSGRVWRPR